MKNWGKKLLAFLLVLSLVTVPVDARANSAETELGVATVERTKTDKTQKQVKKLVEKLKKNLVSKDKVSLKEANDKKVRVIVEVEGNPTIKYASLHNRKLSQLNIKDLTARENKLLSVQKGVQTAMKNSGIESEVILNFTTVVNGFATKVKLGDLEKVSKLRNVKRVYLSNEYERPNMVTSGNMVNANLAWDTGFSGEGMVVAVLDTGVDPSHRDLVMDEKVKLSLTKAKVDELKASDNLPGEYYSEKVPYAYNYYDANENIRDTGASQHGMHVTGTVAANGDTSKGGIKGIAPKAQVLGMKVFSNDIKYATTFTDIYVQALEDAIKLGADVVNMSLGSPAGFYDDNGLEDKLLSNAKENGVISNISAGNETDIMNGWKNPNAMMENPDTGLIGSPSVSKSALSIASYENDALMTAVADVLPEDLNVKNLALTEAGGAPKFSTLANDEGHDFVFLGLGKEEEYADVDVEGKVVLAERGETSFVDKLAAAMKHNAKALIVYNHQAGGDGIVNMAGGDLATIPFAFLTRSSALKLKEAQGKNPAAKLKFFADLKSVPNPERDGMSSFSTWGTTPDLQLKPELTAPGGNIYSIQNGNQYTTMSGTSMAAPHASGGAALVKQYVESLIDKKVLPDMSEAEKVDFTSILLMNTAKIMVDKDRKTMVSPRQQGAGLMDLYAATRNLVTVKDANKNNPSYGKAKVELRDVGNKVRFTLEVKNYGKESVKLSPETTLLNEVIENKRLLKVNDEVIKQKDDAFELAPGESKTVTIDLDITDANDRQFAEGYVVFNKEVKDQDGNFAADGKVSVPFLGFKGHWDELRVLDTFDANELLLKPIDYVVDSDEGQESEFKSSGLFNLTFLEDLQFLDPNNAMIAAGNVEYDMILGVGHIYPMMSQLRNAKSMKYQVLDKAGNLLKTITEEENVRKINRLYTGQTKPYRFNLDAGWDGKIDGQIAKDGVYTYRIQSILDYEGARPQNYDFKIISDNTAPDFVKDDKGDIEYEFDKDTKVIKFKAKDIVPEGLTVDEIAKLGVIEVLNETTNDGDYLEIADVGKLLDEKTNLYEITIDLKPFLVSKDNVIKISVADEIYNFTKDSLKIGPKDLVIKQEKDADIYLVKPDLLTFVGDGNGNKGNTEIEVEVEGYVLHWDSVDKVTADGKEMKLEFVKEVNFEDVGYKGPAYKFTGKVTCKEGFHNMVIRAESKYYNEPFGIGRRFFVDLTAPKVTGQEVYKTNIDTQVLGFRVTDNLHFVEVTRNGDFVKRVDNSESQGFAGTVDETITDTVKLKDGINKFDYKVKDYLYTTDYTVYVVKGELKIEDLLATIKKAEGLDLSKFTSDSAKALKEALNAAREALDKEGVTQEEIDKANENLKNAIDKLENKATAEELKALKDKVEEVKAMDKSPYTEESQKALDEAVKKAEEVLKNKDAKSEDVDKALKDLEDAVKALEKKPEPKNGWVVDEDGVERFYIDGEVQTGLTEVDGKTYLLDEDGAKKLGWQMFEDNWHYFDPDGSMVVSQWRFVYVKLANGEVKRNWKYFNIEGKNIIKFFDEGDNRHLSLVGPDKEYAKGWYKLGRVWTYYKGAWGVMARNEWLDLEVPAPNGGKIMAKKFFNANGYSVNSLYRENGRAYYSQSGPYRYLYYGWKTIGNNTFYFWNPSGRAAVGRVTVRGEIHTFNSRGYLQD